MSAESFLLYYGLRFPVTHREVKSLENDTHPSVVAAVKNGLDTRWGYYVSDGREEFYLFVGKELGIFGAEYSAFATISDAALREVMQETGEKLERAGFEARPALWVQWEPDY